MSLRVDGFTLAIRGQSPCGESRPIAVIAPCFLRARQELICNKTVGRLNLVFYLLPFSVSVLTCPNSWANCNAHTKIRASLGRATHDHRSPSSFAHCAIAARHLDRMQRVTFRSILSPAVAASPCQRKRVTVPAISFADVMASHLYGSDRSRPQEFNPSTRFPLRRYARASTSRSWSAWTGNALAPPLWKGTWPTGVSALNSSCPSSSVLWRRVTVTLGPLEPADLA